MKVESPSTPPLVGNVGLCALLAILIAAAESAAEGDISKRGVRA
jgi:hypothetical protein